MKMRETERECERLEWSICNVIIEELPWRRFSCFTRQECHVLDRTVSMVTFFSLRAERNIMFWKTLRRFWECGQQDEAIHVKRTKQDFFKGGGEDWMSEHLRKIRKRERKKKKEITKEWTNERKNKSNGVRTTDAFSLVLVQLYHTFTCSFVLLICKSSSDCPTFLFQALI